MSEKHAYLAVDCKGCAAIGQKTTITLRHLGVSEEGTVYSVDGLPLSFNVQCEDCGEVSHYDKQQVTTLWLGLPPADFQDMI